jgi:hypothetical protein
VSIYFHPGEYLMIEYKNRHSGFEADEVPHEATDRICWCVDWDGQTITVEFPYDVKMRDGTFQKQLTIPRWHDLYTTERQKLVYNAPYPKGSVKNTYMMPVEDLYTGYWTRIYGKHADVWANSPAAYKALREAIQREGLRAPLVAHKDGSLRCGTHRLMVAKQLGWNEIEAYVTNTTGKVL